MTVTNEFDWPPFGFTLSGKPAGLGIDLMNLLAERLGAFTSLHHGYTWDVLVQKFQEGPD